MKRDGAKRSVGEKHLATGDHGSPKPWDGMSSSGAAALQDALRRLHAKNAGQDPDAPIPYTVSEGPGKKFDSGKPRWGLLPASVAEVVRVLTYGATKYGDQNWRKVDHGRERYFDALMRHAWAWKHGETHDPETGIHHLAHVATNCLFLMELDK